MAGCSFWQRARGTVRRALRASLTGMTCAVVAGGLLLASASGAFAAPALKKGVNLHDWLQLTGKHAPSSAELRMLKMNGFDHVRLVIDPLYLGWKGDGNSAPDIPDIAKVDEAIKMLLAARLNVIIDLHASTVWMKTFEDDPRHEDEIVALWGWMAQHFKDLDNERVVYELFNEPNYYRTPDRYFGFVKRMVAEIRKVSPDRMLLVGGSRGNSPLTLVEMTPIPGDSNITYVFHYYDPLIITHQGLPWVGTKKTVLRGLGNVAYPSSLVDVQKVDVSPEYDRSEALEMVKRYTDDNWNAAHVDKAIAQLKKWSEDNPVNGKPVPIICTEFGVAKGRIDEGSRLRWLGDVATSLDKYNIPWTVWEYNNLFGISEDMGKARVISPEMAMALRIFMQ